MQERLNLLNRISDELNKDLDPDKMLRRVLDLTASYLNASTGSVMLFDWFYFHPQHKQAVNYPQIPGFKIFPERTVKDVRND